MKKVLNEITLQSFVFEVKKKGDKTGAGIIYFTVILLVLLWIYFYFYGPESVSGEICNETSVFLLGLAGFLLLLGIGISIPASVRITDDSIMMFAGDSMKGEVFLDDIEKIELVKYGGNIEIHIYVDRKKALEISEVNLGRENIRALLEELKHISEQKHFPVVDRTVSRDSGTMEDTGNVYIAFEKRNEKSDEDLPYKIK